MTNQTTPTAASARKQGRAGRLVVMLLIAAAGIVAGVRWHARIESLVGMRSADGETSSAVEKNPRQLWTCGMHPQVIQDHPGSCPICHMDLTPLKTDGAAPAGGSVATQGTEPQVAGQGRKVKYWWDPMMNPPYMSDKPGKSPMGMDLVPVYEDEKSEATAAGTVVIDPAVVQNMGVRTALVTEGPLDRAVRLVGYLDEAQPNIRDINLRVSGWVTRLQANTEGMRVQAGDPLFELYSPDLQVGIEELITSRRARGSSTEGPEQTLYEAAARKLELLGLERRQIDLLAKLDKAPDTITFVSPITGDVTERLVVEGAAVKSGDRVLRIVDHSSLWLDAQVFEKDLPLVQVGQKVSASIAVRPDQAIEGQIIFIHPHVDPSTRTALVLVSVPNSSSLLKPGMYATVKTDTRLADRAVLVPREAVIDTGESQVAFVAQGGGRFEPRRVHMGPAGGDGLVQVIDGLSPGESIVTSGQFLLDSESRLREAIQKFLTEKKNAGIDHNQPVLPEAAPVPANLQGSIDSVSGAYLAISTVLGASEVEDTSIDPMPLINAAQALQSDMAGTRLGGLAAAVRQSADAMRGRPLRDQRAAFKVVSEKMIALTDRAPPSAAVAEALYVVHCPMAKADWLQKVKDVANPYYATSMKQCGSVTKTIETRKEVTP